MTGDGSRAPGGHPSPAGTADAPDVAVLRRTPAGWSVGEEDAGDLTCAMVLADLIAAELPDPAAEASDYVGTTGDAAASGAPAGAGTEAGAAGNPAAADPAPADPAGDEGSPDEARRLRATVRQLERALAVRIRVEQAIGILAERHRVRPRQAFEQLRAAARGRGQRVIDIAGDVVASATNPLLPLPEELSRPAMAPRPRSRSQRRSRGDQ
jgi:hypothetical protein